MDAMGVDQSLMMEDAAEDKFPEGLRVLAVDDDCVCLMELDALLRRCKYNPTIVMDAKTALKMLRAGKEKFDLVITEVCMPDMDGFKLLELIGLEMDLPVIMLSADCDKKSVMKGINHGACDYLVKPVCINELKNIWLHVESKRYSEAIRDINGDGDDDQGVQLGTDAKSNDGDDTDENEESTQASITQKKLRVAWTIELHKKFIEAINQIGLDKASPKRILELMNVNYLTRHNISSHLQKYKLYLRRVNPNPLGGAYERWNSYTNNLESFMHNHEHERMGASSGGIASWSPNHFGAAGHSGQHMNTQGSLCMGSLTHGGRRPGYLVPRTPNVRRISGFEDAPVNLQNDILNGIRTSGGGRSAPTNEYQVQPTESIYQYHTHMNAPSTQVESTGILHRGGTSLIPSQVNIPRINQLASYAMPSRPMLLQNQMSPLISNTTSVAGFNEHIVPLNIPSNKTSIGMLNAHNGAPMAPPQLVNGESITTLVSWFSEQMAQFNIASNLGSDGMILNGKSTPGMGRTSMEETDMVNYARSSSTLSNHQTIDCGALTHTHDVGDATGILNVQEGTNDQQGLSGQLHGLNALSSGDISNLLNDDFIGEDADMDG